MNQSLRGWISAGAAIGALLLAIPGCDDSGSAAVARGLGGECSLDEDCAEADQVCLYFKGGYCGLEGCIGDVDCPGGSACVTHVDATNYCFLICASKPQCNVQRSVESEANCVASVDFVDGDQGRKACVPPSG